MTEDEITQRCTPEEKTFYYSVLRPCIELKYLEPQYIFKDSNGRKRKIDFAINSPTKKIAIEIDGYTYHAEGKVTQDKFSDSLTRQNELIIKKWIVIRFSWQQVVDDPIGCRAVIKKALGKNNLALRKNYYARQDIQKVNDFQDMENSNTDNSPKIKIVVFCTSCLAYNKIDAAEENKEVICKNCGISFVPTDIKHMSLSEITRKRDASNSKYK